ncbi:MAG TPA: hypothetical protein VGW75_07170 [Solirubrobacteraceae bacterium]|jgi:hypothetical protein|nr:hypothetical protein [Solirubrobacteraceae bacterium]
MSIDDRYVPILTGRPGEVEALGSSGTLGVVPIFDLPPLRRARAPTKAEVASGKPPPTPETLSDATRRFVRALEKHWEPGQRFYLDLQRLRVRSNERVDPVDFVFDAIRSRGFRPSPCLRMSATATAIGAAARAAESADGLGLRLDGRAPVSDVLNWVREVLRKTRVVPAHTALVVDFGHVAADESRVPALAERLVRALRAEAPWWLIAMATTSAPQISAILPTDEPLRLTRREPYYWRRVVAALGRDAPAFSDYGITGPTSDSDEPAWGASPNLRYTLDDSWLVWKGVTRKRRLPGEDAKPDVQFNEFCRRLISVGSFAGPQTSWGDQMIARYAEDHAFGGSPSKWIAIATSHHLSVVTRSL